MKNKIYTNLDECIKDVFKNASNLACKNVNENIGGPFGAGIIQKIDKNYKILTVESNTVICSKDATCHAEINAIRKASKLLDRFNLDDCILVTTAKSCPMCLAASCWAKIPIIYYGTDYKEAITSGFDDDNIAKYIKGENQKIIKEIKIENTDSLEPFKIWNKKENKTMY